MEQKLDKTKDKDNPKPTKKKVKKGLKIEWGWQIKIFLVTMSLSLIFGILSEMVLSSSQIIIAVVIILLLFVVGTLFDMVGVASAACPIEAFRAMASKKEKGAKESIALVKNADKVSSFCCDIVGDICGILSGSAGAAISLKLAISAGGFQNIVIAALISSCISALIVTGKSFGKMVALNKSREIVYIVGKFISNFTSSRDKK